MKIVRRKSTGLAVYLIEGEAVLDADGLHGEVRAVDLTPDTHEVVEADLPSGLLPVAGALALVDGVWSVFDEAAYTARLIDPAVARPFTDMVQSRIDEVARERSYTNGVSCASYCTSTNPVFRGEAQAFVTWRDRMWEACYTLLSEVRARARPVPTEAELLAALPAMEWPTQA